MDPMGYIFLFQPNYHQLSIGNRLIHTLSYFASNRPSSAYDVFKGLRSSDFGAAYKNVHKNVKKILSLKLIKREKKPLEFHGSVYYKLTPLGVFYILAHKDKFDPYILNDIVKNYGNDEFFEIFVYPYIERRTLEEFKSDSIGREIFEYFSAMCKRIEWSIESLYDYKQRGGVEYSVGFWNEIAHNSDKDGIDREQESFITGLKVNLGIEWLSRNIKFECISNNIIKISRGKNSLLIKLELNELRSKVIIIEKDKVIASFDVQPMMNDLHIVTFVPLPQEFLVDDVRRSMEEDHRKLVEKLAFSLIPYSKQHFLQKSETENLQHDLGILARDSKFMRLLKSANRKYTTCYNEFGKQLGKGKKSS